MWHLSRLIRRGPPDDVMYANVESCKYPLRGAVFFCADSGGNYEWFVNAQYYDGYMVGIKTHFRFTHGNRILFTQYVHRQWKWVLSCSRKRRARPNYRIAQGPIVRCAHQNDTWGEQTPRMIWVKKFLDFLRGALFWSRRWRLSTSIHPEIPNGDFCPPR